MGHGHSCPASSSPARRRVSKSGNYLFLRQWEGWMLTAEVRDKRFANPIMSWCSKRRLVAMCAFPFSVREAALVSHSIFHPLVSMTCAPFSSLHPIIYSGKHIEHMSNTADNLSPVRPMDRTAGRTPMDWTSGTRRMRPARSTILTPPSQTDWTPLSAPLPFPLRNQEQPVCRFAADY